MGLDELIVISPFLYTVLGLITLCIYNVISDANYNIKSFEAFVVWFFWPLIIILLIAYCLFNIKNGIIRVFKNIKNLFKK